jgi:glycosyltransferase involved in cell wall biosynthesis
LIIAQIAGDDAPEYERKSQRIDLSGLRDQHDVRIGQAKDAQIVHVYARRAYVKLSRLLAKREAVTPFNVPEAVEDHYFLPPRPSATPSGHPTIGSFLRPNVTPVIEQTMARIHRFREDVSWSVFTHPPSPDELSSLDAWVDPAVEEEDYDGFVAEALAAGVIVVAARTAVNDLRCEKGRTGFLVPPRDPNEMTHAILTALFKPEAARSRSDAALQTVSKFRARHRLRVLSQMYERLIP